MIALALRTLSSSQHPGLWPKVEVSYGDEEGVPPTLGSKADYKDCKERTPSFCARWASLNAFQSP